MRDFAINNVFTRTSCDGDSFHLLNLKNKYNVLVCFGLIFRFFTLGLPPTVEWAREARLYRPFFQSFLPTYYLLLFAFLFFFPTKPSIRLRNMCYYLLLFTSLMLSFMLIFYFSLLQ